MKIKPPKISEHTLQVQCVHWFRVQYPKKIIFACPNGGARNIIVATKLKAEGVLRGVPDLCIPEPTKKYHGLWVELKVGYNKASPEQIQLIRELIFRKYACVICYNLDEFMKVIKDYFIDTITNASI